MVSTCIVDAPQKLSKVFFNHLENEKVFCDNESSHDPDECRADEYRYAPGDIPISQTTEATPGHSAIFSPACLILLMWRKQIIIFSL